MDRESDAPAATARLIHRGDLFWLPPDPVRGSIPGAPHPHVVVQDDLFNHSRLGTVVVCALTSNLARAAEPGNLLLDPNEGGLARQSVTSESHSRPCGAFAAAAGRICSDHSIARRKLA